MKGVMLLFTGLAIGWLMGLAVTPVLSAVLTSLLAVVVAVVAILVGLPSGQGQLAALIRDRDAAEKSDDQPLKLADVSVVPITVLTIGIAIGATGGLTVRANGWLLTERAIAALAPAAQGESANAMAFSNIGLYASPIDSEDCARLASQIDFPDALRTEMLSSVDPVLQAVALNAPADSATLVGAVRLVCHTRE